MQYKVLHIISKPQGHLDLKVDAPVPLGVGAQFEGPVTGEIRLTNAGATITARGILRARVLCDCSRCLTQHPIDLTVEVNEECRLSQIDRSKDADDETQRIPLLDGDFIDLTELVRQALAVSVPPRSLCRPDCKGICAQCGRSLNAGDCGCEAPLADNRWRDLAQLLEQDED